MRTKKKGSDEAADDDALGSAKLQQDSPAGPDDENFDEMIKLSGGRTKCASEIKVAVYGGGSFGTAMACVLGRKGVQATLVVRRPDVVDQININHRNPYYQSDLLLPRQVRGRRARDPARWERAVVVIRTAAAAIMPSYTLGRSPLTSPSASTPTHR